jgi:hypothetical protein
MDRAAMLEHLSCTGRDAGTEYNGDDPDVNGWFGWVIEDSDHGTILTVRHESGETRALSTASWQLVPIGLLPTPPSVTPQPASQDPVEGPLVTGG